MIYLVFKTISFSTGYFIFFALIIFIKRDGNYFDNFSSVGCQKWLVMGKTVRLVVCGASDTGKTAILENLIYGENAQVVQYKTIEDTYLAQIDTERGVKETVKIHDTPGSECSTTTFPKHYLHFGEGFVLVYSITSQFSFNCVEYIKKEIDRTREKKDVSVIVIGNKSDLQSDREVTLTQAQNWAAKEKVRLFETTIKNRKSLAEPFMYICSRMTQPPAKTTLLGARKIKQQSFE